MGRKAAPKLPECGHTFQGVTCTERGPHRCEPRAARVVAFFEKVLVHTKGRFARKPFVLAPWQREDIIEPLFGEVIWSEELGDYVRRYVIAWIEIARKNGKSELLAGIALYMLCSDDEESAEIYGAAKDRDQARKVFDVAMRMVQLSLPLQKILRIVESKKRIVFAKTYSAYEAIDGDSEGNLGHNPSCVVFDEVLTQPDDLLWDSLKQGMGTRTEPLMIAATTAGSNIESFAGHEHRYSLKVLEDPDLDPRRFVYIAAADPKDDPFDEATWYKANPGLGDFLSIETLRQEALEAQNDPRKLNTFLQFRLNIWTQQVTRWIPILLWDQCDLGGASSEDLVRLPRGFAGLDLASTTDLASWVMGFRDDDDIWRCRWRFWTPEEQLPRLDSFTDGAASEWMEDGWLTATEGDWIDYDVIHEEIEDDLKTYDLLRCGVDPYEAAKTMQLMQKLKGDDFVDKIRQGYALSPALKEIERLIRAGLIDHGGNPLMRWNVDAVEVKQDDLERIKMVKPRRHRDASRVDGVAALAGMIRAWQFWVEELEDSYAPASAAVSDGDEGASVSDIFSRDRGLDL